MDYIRYDKNLTHGRAQMSRAIPFTKAQIRRAIDAAREAGLRVTGIAPDGTLILEDRSYFACPECGGGSRVVDAQRLLLECTRCGTKVAQPEDRRDGEPRKHVL
jgi:hypothetical protein